MHEAVSEMDPASLLAVNVPDLQHRLNQKTPQLHPLAMKPVSLNGTKCIQ